MRFTLGKKLGLGFGVILGLMALSMALSFGKLGDIRSGQDRVIALRVPTIAALKDFQRDLNQSNSKGRQVILAGADPARRDAAKRLFDSSWDEIGKDMGRLDALSAHWVVQANRDRLEAVKQKLPPSGRLRKRP